MAKGDSDSCRSDASRMLFCREISMVRREMRFVVPTRDPHMPTRVICLTSNGKCAGAAPAGSPPGAATAPPPPPRAAAASSSGRGALLPTLSPPWLRAPCCRHDAARSS